MDLLIDDARAAPATGVATLERWFAEQGAPPLYDLARSGAAGISVADLLDGGSETVTDLLSMSLDYGPGTGGSRLRNAVLRTLDAPAGAEVVVTSGAVEALLLLCIASRDHGSILVGSPFYSGLMSAPFSARCKVDVAPVWSAVDGLHLDELAARVTPGTALVVINSPHNPSGQCASLTDIDELAAHCRRAGALLVVDEVARGTLDPGAPSAVGTRGFAAGDVVVLGDVSKSLGLGGLRIGWLCTADPHVCTAAATAKDGTTVASSTLAEHLAAIALERYARLLEPVTAAARANLAVLARVLDSVAAADEWVPPTDGLVAFPRIPARYDVEKVVADLRRSEVGVVPGSLFGEPQCLRLGIGARPAAFAEGARRLDTVLHS